MPERQRAAAQKLSRDAARGPADEPPIYAIDLSLPPAQRYVEVARDFKGLLKSLTGLFDELVHDMHPKLPLNSVVLGARLFLRRLHSREQTEELRGISQTAGVDMYLLVAFNTLLDLFMGCSSGGVRVSEGDGAPSKMLHYRTLDWDMDPLRQIVVQLEYVRGPKSNVVARSVTYVGYVGVLTGVKQGLSMSLNFRPTHDSSSYLDAVRFHGHQLLVLLGLRPAISSLLRDVLFSNTPLQIDEQSDQVPPLHQKPPPNPPTTLSQLASIPTTAAYLILSNGHTTAVMEKDHLSAVTRTSRSFISATNHDAAFEHDPQPQEKQPQQQQLQTLSAMQALIDESIDRKRCIDAKWQRWRARYRRANPGAADDDVAAHPARVVQWVGEWPITNECTHYAAVMDPTAGEVVWCRRRGEPARPP